MKSGIYKSYLYSCKGVNDSKRSGKAGFTLTKSNSVKVVARLIGFCETMSNCSSNSAPKPPITIGKPPAQLNATPDEEDLFPRAELEEEEVLKATNVVVTKAVTQKLMSVARPDDDSESSDEEMEVLFPFKYIESEPKANEFDDLEKLVKKAEGNKKTKEYEHLVNMIYLMLEIIAVDNVFQTQRNKSFELYVRLAGEMNEVVERVDQATSKYYNEKFLSLLPDVPRQQNLPPRKLPVDVIAKHNQYADRKPTETFTKRCVNKRQSKPRTAEEIKAAQYGKKIWDDAHSGKNKINQFFVTQWRELKSGETPFGLLYAIRRDYWLKHLEAEALKKAGDSVKYQAKKQKKSNSNKKATGTVEEEDDEEVEVIDKADLLKKMKEEKFQQLDKEFSDDWYPLEWLSFLLLSLPAGKRAISFMIPFSPVQATDRMVYPPKFSNVIKEDSSSNDNSKRAKTTPAKSPGIKNEFTHQINLRFADWDVMLGEKRKLDQLEEMRLQRDTLKEAIAIAQERNDHETVAELQNKLLKLAYQICKDI